MKHYGDITKLSGYELPIVDCITGGSPCQDLSVAGKRAGLGGERSGLFMEQIRIVKEMRERDRKLRQLRGGGADFIVRPRYMVWENVPGAFSSNKGKDFQAVLTEIVRIVEPEAADVPMPDKGKWSKSGCLYDQMGWWSVAWRVHDAQFWGVPQRRKRIALVADFGGLSAPEILFERKGMLWDSEESTEEGQGIAGRTENRIGTPKCLNGWDVQSKRIMPTDGVAGTLYAGGGGGCEPYVFDDAVKLPSDEGRETLRAQEHGHNLIVYEPTMIEMTSTKNTIVQDGISPTLTARMGSVGNQVNAVQCMDIGFYDTHEENKDPQIVCGMSGIGEYKDGVAPLRRSGGDNGLGSENLCVSYQEKITAVDVRNFSEDKINGTLQSSADHNLNSNSVCREWGNVRRLTPLECERLQGFPDGWTDIGEWIDSKGKKHNPSDTPRYKSIGNSIAIPFWFYLLRRISAQYERPATLGSLFDGIGGFPLAWERCNGKGTAIWASEIEEFPIAVTKKWFPETT